MAVKEVYSMCGMCAVRCPIKVEVENDAVTWIEGNPHVPGIEGALCAKGSAGIAFEYDTERPQTPLLRVGPRGSGQWRKASWDEALDYITEKLKAVRALRKLLVRSVKGPPRSARAIARAPGFSLTAFSFSVL